MNPKKIVVQALISACEFLQNSHDHEVVNEAARRREILQRELRLAESAEMLQPVACFSKQLEGDEA